MDVRTKVLVFFQDFEGPTEVFAPGRLPGYPRRGPPAMYRHHKGLRIKKGISKGVVYKLSEPKRQARCIPPPRIALAMFIIPFVGVVRGLWGSKY